MFEINDFDAVRISLASPEQIRSWSYGDVTKPETINYRTLKPERDGLFCERIFGPTKDFECYCGKYKRIRYKGVICDKCGVEVARAKVRRERMGHIELACPVSHIWFAKGIPSRLGLLLDLSPRSLEHVLYFSQYIVTSINQEAREETILQLEEKSQENIAKQQNDLEEKIAQMEQDQATVEEINRLREQFVEEKTKQEEDISNDIEQLQDIQVKKILTENQYHDLTDKYGDVFEAGMGAEAILQIIKNIDLDELRNNLLLETQSSSGQRRKKASKQLRVVEAFRNSGNRPEWMILTVLPVLPPDLRPMVQLDGGRFATSDLNDLYRRVINRNNRLRHLIDIGAPVIIIRNEKRMLQEAVDSLIDNGRRGRAISISGNHKLKSLSDMLRGKQGRFRQNLLGKRVDYSGRSVIVCGPELKLHQCGLPRRMALELFKPFVMRRLVAQGLAPNIKSARRLVERAKAEVYDILEEVIKERPVLLNRAPTLHRLSIQAFEPVLIDGSAIQIHPLVCSAFNADFDGDQMAVHVPLSKAAVKEAREMMLSHHNILLPSSGEPTVTPTLDMVLGCYYLTSIRHQAEDDDKVYGSFKEAKLAYEFGIVDLREEINVRDGEADEPLKTSVGRILFNEILPKELGFFNKVIDKGTLKQIAIDCCRLLPDEETGQILDSIKQLGFHYASKSGITIAMNDIEVPRNKPEMLEAAEARVATIEDQFDRGLITDEERYNGIIGVWMETTDDITNTISNNLDRYGGIYMMATSGAKGNISQIRQMAGMRGLMTDPSGKIIEFPIKSSLREGHSILEYFISTHGARKGLADTALRTSDSGYLTRRLIDVAQDVITAEEDCGTLDGVWITEPKEKGLLPSFSERIIGRLAASDILHPESGEVIVGQNEEINENKASEIVAAGLTSVYARTPLTCQSRRGTCQRCYGRDLARGDMVGPNVAVGIIAAESIGEPGTQLTLRTFHTGGVVGLDITSGLPRVEELFEARTPKGQAIISEIDGAAEVIQDDEGRRIKIISTEVYQDDYTVPTGWKVMVKNGQAVDIGAVLATQAAKATKKKKTDESAVPEVQPMVARFAGEVSIKKKQLVINYVEKEEREYVVTSSASIWIENGQEVKAGQQLTDGSVNPHDILRILGKEAVQQYLVDEVQKVYRSQGVTINDKHIEVIGHQMLTKVRIDSAGDTDLVPDELVDKYIYEDTNAKVLAEGGEPATAHTLMLGITRASLSTESWLAAASFQETTRILTEAAVNGKVDRLVGLKENVIIGKLIPAHYLPEDTVSELITGEEDEETLSLLAGEEEDEVQRLLASIVAPDEADIEASEEEEEPSGPEESEDSDDEEIPDIEEESDDEEDSKEPLEG